MKTPPATIEPLEDRIAPAMLNAAGTLLTYTDIDGDLVKVAFTHATMAKTDFTFNGNQFLDGDTTTPQSLVEINLVGKTGAGLTLTATTPKNGKGNSHADVGLIAGANTDLGVISVDGDVENITAGTGAAGTVGLKSFTALSLNRHGNAAGTSTVENAGTFTVKTDVLNAMLNFTGGVKSISIGGNIQETISGVTAGLNISGPVGSIQIGGSVIGGTGTGQMITTDSAVGTVAIGGSVRGGSVDLATVGSQIDIFSVKTFTIGGDVLGDGGLSSGTVTVNHNADTFNVGGSIIGGNGEDSGSILVMGASKSFTLGGSIIANDGEFFSGLLHIEGTAGTVKIGGSIIGNGGETVGTLECDSDVGSISIGHNVIGGNSTGTLNTNGSGVVDVEGNAGSITIGGDLVAGHLEGSGSIKLDGVVEAGGTIGALKIGGNINGNAQNLAVISAGAKGTTGAIDAIKSINVKGSVQSASIFTGYGDNGLTQNTDSGIGSVTIGGDLAGSFIIAGSSKGTDGIAGTTDDQVISTIATIGSVKVGGDFRGLAGDATSYFIYGPKVEKFSVGDTTYTESELIGGHVIFNATGTAVAWSVF